MHTSGSGLNAKFLEPAIETPFLHREIVLAAHAGISHDDKAQLVRRTSWIIAGLFILFAGLLPWPVLLAMECPPEGYSREQLFELKESGFVVADETRRNTLAIGLMGCLSDPDPLVRDGVAFEAVSFWLRGQQLSAETLLALNNDLLGQIRSDSDPAGFQQPFAALLLSEVVRADRIEAVLTPAMRDELVVVAASYLAEVDDYRGFSANEGWRHGVAHGSDLVLQLALNPQIDGTQIQRLVGALALQVAPAGEIFYVYGEPTRLARAAYYSYSRGILPDSFWESWFLGISSPAPLESWADAFSSQAGLAKRHNTLSFLLALHFNAALADDEQGAALRDLALQAITRVSGG